MPSPRCNTTSLDATYSSNHALLYFGGWMIPTTDKTRASIAHLLSFLDLNTHADKKQVATMKIFHHHPDVDMEPFFEWDMAMLTVVANWFDKALTCNGIDDLQVDARKVSAIYQFIHDMPGVADSAPQP